MAILRQLREPDRYRACDWDLLADAVGRAHWLGVFRWHVDAVLLPLIRTENPRVSDAQRDAFRADYLERFAAIERAPQALPRLDIITLTELRRETLDTHGLRDPFRGLKDAANAAALELLPGVLAELDAVDEPERRRLLALGLMAGNIFDMGSKATADRPDAANAAFRETRAAAAGRHWLRDDRDTFWTAWEQQSFGHAVLFVDNAGGDLVLGNLPLVRWMLGCGARVTLAANAVEALNDITATELPPLLDRVAEADAALAEAWHDGRLRVLSTGSTTPLIDLTRLDGAFVDAIADADLIMLHGMGRAVESNYHARFTSAATWTATLKDEAVADRVGGAVFDHIFRYAPYE
jgi:uncharacterized protein with ATP-grasp and redox domains